MNGGLDDDAILRRSDGLSVLDPPLWGQNKVVAACLISKPLEFERFRNWIAQLLPGSTKLDGAAAAHPVVDDHKALLGVSISSDVGQRSLWSRAIHSLDEWKDAGVEFAHGIEEWLIRLAAEVEDAFVAVFVGGFGLFVGGVVVDVFEPMPADAAFGFEQGEGEVLVEGSAVSLGFDEPACAGGVRKAGVHGFDIELSDEAGLAAPCVPVG